MLFVILLSFITMKFIARNDGFICDHCGKCVLPAERTFRNHCPFCLYSKHVDGDVPGDRASHCGGIMKPISIALGGKKTDFTLTHQCLRCGHIRKNRQQLDDDVAQIIKTQKKIVTEKTRRK